MQQDAPVSILPPCSSKEELPVAGTKASAWFFFLKQMTLFHPRIRLCKIRLSHFYWEYPWTSGNYAPFQKSGFLGDYSKSREGRDKLGSLCPLPPLLVCCVLQ